MLPNDDITAKAFILYSAEVLRYFRARVDSEMDAEDLCQDAFLRLVENKEYLREDTLRMLLSRICRNIRIDYYRRKQYRRDHAEELDYLMQSDSVSTHEESIVHARDIRTMELKIVRQLPAKRKITYALRRYRELPIIEIARKLNVSPRTAENNYAAACHTVRETLRACI